MDREDQRKRAFSQAFQRMSQPRHGDHNAKPAKRILSYPLGSKGLHHQRLDQENEAPLDLDSTAAFDRIPGTQIRHPPPVDLQYANPALYNYASLQHELYGNESGPDLHSGAGGDPPPLLRNGHLGCPALYDTPLPTPPIVRGQSMFGPSPYVRPDLSSTLSSIVDSSAQFGPAVSPMSDATTAIGPLTPSALNFGDLSLSSQGYSPPSSPSRHGAQNGRATVRFAPVSSLARHFSEINPNEVIIMFDKGKQLVKVDKYPLCSASRFFAQFLSGPFLDHDLTRCIRLRHDFPYAITTMLHFVETGNYMFDQRAFAAFPLLTALDFHVHAYLVSSKYGIGALQECAVNVYLDTAEHEMKLEFLDHPSGQLSDAQTAVPSSFIISATENVGEGVNNTPIDRFLSSLVLLWRNTQSRLDGLRKAVLELIKRDLNKLLRAPFFVTLMQEMVGFGDDVVASLEDDGFEVKAFQVPAGESLSQTVRFGL